MDNRIVLELIKKDLDELQTLVDALQKDELPNQLLIDITIGRTKTLLKEFSLLQGEAVLPGEDTVKVLEEANMQIAQPDAKQENPEPISEIEPDFVEKEAEIEESPEALADDEVEQSADINLEEESEVPVRTETEELPVDEPEPESENVVKEEVFEEVALGNEIDDELPPVAEEQEESEEKVEEIGEKKIIGERFVKEPTLNERLASTKNQESKIKGKPLTSLKGAIGINDKFMFTRELFNNDRNGFDKAVDDLDSCESLIQAIEYLEKNFKWTKNEISLKFIGLVKQRFSK